VSLALPESLACLRMKGNGQAFLGVLATFAPNNFAKQFSGNCSTLGLGAVLDEDELNLLYRATFDAALCNIAINGLGGCRGQIKPEREPNRIQLEWRYMAARDAFYASPGWQGLPRSVKESVNRIFLRVQVADNRLAW
jgi:hypothetical protein